MRTIFLLLLAANLAFFAWHSGAFGLLPPWISPESKEALPASQQITPGALVIASTNPDTPPASAAASCMEWGGFTAENAKAAEEWLSTLALGNRLETFQRDEQAAWIVYLPPHRNRAEADSAARRLRAADVADFFIIQDNSPLRLAISLGVFKTEEAAKAQQAALQAKGINGIRIGQRPTTLAKTWFRIRDLGTAERDRVEAVRPQFPTQDFRPCA